jgi:Tfp pilus assembly protein PilF
MFEKRGDRAKAAEAYQRALTSAPDLDEARSALQRLKGG